MSRNVRILELAKKDVDDIFDWLAIRSVQGAISWYLALLQSIRTVADRPEQYSVIPGSESNWNRRIRQALFKTRFGRRYRAVFESSDQEVVVLRIFRPGQRSPRLRDIPPAN